MTAKKYQTAIADGAPVDWSTAQERCAQSAREAAEDCARRRFLAPGESVEVLVRRDESVGRYKVTQRFGDCVAMIVSERREP